MATLTINSNGGTVNTTKTDATSQGNSFGIGVNLDGMEYNGGPNAQAYFTYAVPSLAELQYYRSQGQDLIRLPISWESLQTTLNGPLNATYLANVESVIQNAASLGMKVILDLHDFGGYNGNKLGSAAVTDANFANVWTQLATAFAGNPGIAGYDLMNEPNGMPSADAWPNAAQAAITAIRTVDKSTAIYVEGDNWSGAGTWTQVNNGLASLKDPSNNLIFSAHLYLDSDNSGTHFDWAQQASAGVTTQLGVERLSNFVSWLQANNLKGDIGEIGAGNDNAGWLASLDNTLAYAKASNVPVIYWAGGPWWGNYQYSVEPTNGVSAPQMAVLDKYSGNYPIVAVAQVSGTADANATIYLSENQVLLATTTANAAGMWNYTFADLADGVHIIVAGENPPTVDGTIAATVFDLVHTPPTVAITAQKLTGVGATDNITNNGAVTLTGTVTGTAGTTVAVYDGTTELGDATLGANGSWTYATTLVAGAHALYAVAADLAGNTASTAAEPTIIVETAPPIVTIATPSVSATTATAVVTVTGTVVSALDTTVQVYSGNTDLGAATLDGNGNWTFTDANLKAGTYDFKAIATDLAGNTTTSKAPFALRIGVTGQGYTAFITYFGANGKPSTQTDLAADGSVYMIQTWTYDADGSYQIACTNVIRTAATISESRLPVNGPATV